MDEAIFNALVKACDEAASFISAQFGPLEDINNSERWSDSDAFDVYRELDATLKLARSGQ